MCVCVDVWVPRDVGMAGAAAVVNASEINEQWLKDSRHYQTGKGSRAELRDIINISVCVRALRARPASLA